MADVDVWQFYEQLGQGDRTHLSKRQRAVAAICDWRQEVNSGGLDSYFRYWGGDTAREAISALPTALGPAWSHLLEDAMGLLGPDYPTDVQAREAVLEAKDLDNALNALDDRFYDLEASHDADALLARYLADGGS